MQQYWDDHAFVRQLRWPQLIFADSLRHVIRGKAVLDVGCGGGALSAHLIEMGAASVVGIDFSQQMIDLARARYAARKSLTFVRADILKADLKEHFEIVTGIAILHEIGPTDYPMLVDFLDRHLATEGFGWFQENSFFNPIVRWFRTHMVGRWGVPRYGSPDETPFDRERFDFLRNRFAYCERSVEAFVFFQLANHYALRLNSRWIADLSDGADRNISRSKHLESLKLAWSYYQHIYVSHKVPKSLLPQGAEG